MSRISIELERIVCNRHTRDDEVIGRDRDEVYWIVAGGTPSGDVYKKLPRASTSKGYWGFYEGTSLSHDKLIEVAKTMDRVGQSWQARRYRRMASDMTLWRGNVDNNEQVTLTVIFKEQDNDTLTVHLPKLFKSLTSDAFGDFVDDLANFANLPGSVKEAQKSLDEAWKMGERAVKMAKMAFQGSGHDSLCAFTVQIANVGGKQKIRWREWGNGKIQGSSPNETTGKKVIINAGGGSASYVIEVAVNP